MGKRNRQRVPCRPMGKCPKFHLFIHQKHKPLGVVPKNFVTLVFDAIPPNENVSKHLFQLLEDVWCTRNPFPHLVVLPRLHTFLAQITKIHTKLTRIILVLSPGMTILSLELQSVPPSYRTIVSHILLAACLTILRHWKDPNTPEVAEVTQTIHTHGSYEVLFSSSVGNFETVKSVFCLQLQK